MANFLFVYYGGKMETDPKLAKKSMAEWMAWFEKLGKAVVDGGNPTQAGKVVSKTGVKSGAMGEAVTGYSVISAQNLEAAVEIAKTSPQIGAGGQIAVYSIMSMM